MQNHPVPVAHSTLSPQQKTTGAMSRRLRDAKVPSSSDRQAQKAWIFHGCGGLWVAFSLEINPVEEWIGSGLQNSTSCWFQPPALEKYSLKLILFPKVRGEKRKYLKPAPSQCFFFSVSLLTSTRFLCFGPVVSLEQYGSVFKLKQVVSEFWQTKIYCDHPNHGTVVKRERNDYVEKSSVAKEKHCKVPLQNPY